MHWPAGGAIAAVVLAAVCHGAAAADEAPDAVVYREVFPKSSRTFADVGWKVFVGTDARDASGASAIAGAAGHDEDGEALNSGEVAANAPSGHTYVREGDADSPYLLICDELPPLRPPLLAMRWRMDLIEPDAVVHVVVRVDADGDGRTSEADQWFIAADAVRDPQEGEGLALVDFDAARATWKQFDVIPGRSRRDTGRLPTDVAGAAAVAALPDATIVAVGLYSPARRGRPRFDSFEVRAAGLAMTTPQGRAAALLAKYADQVVTTESLEERWPHLTRHLRARGPRQNVAAWNPTLDVPVKGRTLYLHADQGSDEHDGLAADRPFATLQHAVDQLQPGDALLVGPGAYYQPTVWLRNIAGRSDLPVYIRAEPRGAATISSAWPDAAEGLVPWVDEGDGLWSAPFPSRASGDRLAMGGFVAPDGQRYFLFGMRSLEDLLSDAVAFTPGGGYSGVNPMPWPGYGFALEGGRCWLRTPAGHNPNGRSVIASTYLDHESSLLRLDQASHVIIDGLRFEGAGDKAVRANRNSPWLTVRNCVVEYCRNGVGPDDHGLVEWCEYTYPGYKRFADELKVRVMAAGQRGGNPMYGFVKRVHGARTEGHLIGRPWTTPKDNRGVGPLYCEARYNFCHETFDGDGLGGWSESSAHHSVYLYQYDNAVELEGGIPSESRNNRFHHNLIISCLYGAISHQEDTTEPMGPQWVYRNVVLGNYPKGYSGPDKLDYGMYDTGDDAWLPWTVCKYEATNADAIHYDHNLFWMRGGGLLSGKESTEVSRRKMHWRNNVLIFSPEGLKTSGDFDLQCAANAWVSPKPRPDIQGDSGLYVSAIDALKLRDPADLDLRPADGSPLIDAGVAIPGEPSGSAATVGPPDIGPFEHGLFDEPMPGDDWPRPRRRVFNAAPPKALVGEDLPARLVSPPDR